MDRSMEGLEEYCGLKFHISESRVLFRSMERLEKYCGVKFHISESHVLPAVDLIDPTARPKGAIGARGGVSRCSNHAEVNHHHGNARVHANSNFATRLRVLIQLVMGNMETFNMRLGRQLRQHQRKLEIKLSQSTEEIVQDVYCNCKVHERNKLMFQCEGFCIHTCQVRTLQPKSEHMIPEQLMHGPRTPVEITIEQEIWPLTEHQETGSGVMCGSVAEREYEGNIPHLIRSLTILLGKSKVEAADILFKYLSSKGIVYEDIEHMDVDEISNLKIQICESRSEATKPKARVTVSLIANDGKVECVVYPFKLKRAFEKCITTLLVPHGSSSGQ